MPIKVQTGTGAVAAPGSQDIDTRETRAMLGGILSHQQLSLKTSLFEPLRNQFSTFPVVFSRGVDRRDLDQLGREGKQFLGILLDLPYDLIDCCCRSGHRCVPWGESKTRAKWVPGE